MSLLNITKYMEHYFLWLKKNNICIFPAQTTYLQVYKS